jgi:hypothetical protein
MVFEKRATARLRECSGSGEEQRVSQVARG